MYTDQLPAADLDYLGWLEDQWVVEEFETIIAAEWSRPTLDNGSGYSESEDAIPPRAGFVTWAAAWAGTETVSYAACSGAAEVAAQGRG